MFTGFRFAFFFSFLLCGIIPRGLANPFPTYGPTVPGRVARLRRGVAYAPAKAPLSVKRAIWAANVLRSKPYRWGGGHATFFDVGYDCSGTVSYALAAAGLLRTPMSSNELTRFGARGRGKWITIYARNGHAFAVIAGLRLDTTAWNRWSDREAPRWQLTPRPPRGFEPRHPDGL
ncbi:MAG: NlpC/P60 family protein [Chthoniobacterales bacterium]